MENLKTIRKQVKGIKDSRQGRHTTIKNVLLSILKLIEERTGEDPKVVDAVKALEVENDSDV